MLINGKEIENTIEPEPCYIPSLQARRVAYKEARKRYKSIYPCGSKKRLYECFTKTNNSLVFWYNDPIGSTRIVTLEERESKYHVRAL